ncbi:MAG: class I SAM-dependent methyltransferase [Pseudomonadota bacterium]
MSAELHGESERGIKLRSPGFFERVIAPRIVARACGCSVCGRLRNRVVPLARGVVCEFGVGAGWSAPLYDRAAVEQVIGVDPDDRVLIAAAPRFARAGVPAELRTTAAADTGLADASVDTVVSTYTLCTIPDLNAALMEARRILKPGGQLLFCEHGRSDRPSIARWQDRVNAGWRVLAGGCNINRDIAATITAAGFRIGQLDRFVPRSMPAIVSTHFIGSADPA